jgi:hypothetical protein
METNNDWHQVAANDDDLHQDNYNTFEILLHIKSVLKQITLQKLSHKMDIPKYIVYNHSRFKKLVANGGQNIQDLHADIYELEDLLAERHDPSKLETYGTVNQHLGRRSFHGGFIDKRRSVPLLRRSPPDVIRLLVNVPSFGDYIKRENHSNFGIHYHYLDSNKKRSDTVLCFENNSSWPLLAEKHAEKSAHFSARPQAWSQNRRQAVYDVLNTEKEKFEPDKFRLPSKGSTLVWQENAVSLSRSKKGLEIVLSDKSRIPLR